MASSGASLATISYYTYQAGLSGTTLTWNVVEIGTVSQKTLSLTLTGGVFDMLTLGYDYPNQVSFTQLNAGTRQTVACAGVQSTTSPLHFGNFAALGQGWTSIQSSMQDWGFWNRALTTTEVTQLRNAGAGVPYNGL